MTNPRKYFHDRFVLLMLTINVFLTFVCIALILFRLGDTSSSYIQSYRSNLGLNSYGVSGAGQLISFGVFSLLVLIGQFLISLRLHGIRKHASWIVMVLAALLLLLQRATVLPARLKLRRLLRQTMAGTRRVILLLQPAIKLRAYNSM